VPAMFKYADNDRVLTHNQCLKDTNGLMTLKKFADMQIEDEEKFKRVAQILDQYLPYRDEGIAPRGLYPAGKWWNKLCLLSEFMTSVDCLISGQRVVGREGDGYLEQLHGFNILWGHNYIHHYGSPNFKQAIGKEMKANPEDVPKHLNNKVFLMKCDKMIAEYLRRRS